MSERRDLYPGYDVLAKWDTPSWNEPTRKALAERLRLGPDSRRFLTEEEWATLEAVAAGIVPQPENREDPIPVAALIDHKLAEGEHDGYRRPELPDQAQAWRRGLAALDAEARRAYSTPFRDLGSWAREELLKAAEAGCLEDPAWGGMPAKLFFSQRIIPDVVRAYYSHPTAWNEVGFGGPAGPRGYVRTDFDRRDPWEAAEAGPGGEDEARAENLRVGRTRGGRT